MNKFSKLKIKIKKLIDEKIRFSIKFRITLSYSIVFGILSILSTVGIIYLFKNRFPNLDENIYVSLLIILLVFKGLELLINMLVSYKVSKKSLKPIHSMIEEVKEISINDLDKRVDVSGINNEFKDLAKTFNTMIDEMQVAIESQNQFVSDASHELRTPISVIQGYANLLSRWGKDDREVLEESISAIKEESQSMKKLIESLLFLARGDKNTQIIEKEDFRLKDLIDEVLKETIMIDKSHDILNSNNEDVIVFGDRNLIKEALRVFIDNSIKYTKEGGYIKINTFKNKKGIYINIEDNGIGIGKKDLPNIFNRFYRSDESRNKQSGGCGLGMSIAKYIVDNHDGKIKVYSKLNEGTIVSIELPTK